MEVLELVLAELADIKKKLDTVIRIETKQASTDEAVMIHARRLNDHDRRIRTIEVAQGSSEVTAKGNTARIAALYSVASSVVTGLVIFYLTR